MDYISFEKVWQEDNLIELKIVASSEFASAYQNCYIQDVDLEIIAKRISEYAQNYKEVCYLEFGKKEGDFTPAFSMCILPADMSGHLKIEVDIEIDDNSVRMHRCCFYVNSELGLVEIFGQSIRKLVLAELGEMAVLNQLEY